MGFLEILLVFLRGGRRGGGWIFCGVGDNGMICGVLLCVEVLELEWEGGGEWLKLNGKEEEIECGEMGGGGNILWMGCEFLRWIEVVG